MRVKYGTQEIRNRKKPNVSRGDAEKGTVLRGGDF
jgi:hypothetical protein